MASRRRLCALLLICCGGLTALGASPECAYLWPETHFYLDGSPGGVNKIDGQKPASKDVASAAISGNWVLNFTGEAFQHLTFDPAPTSTHQTNGRVAVELWFKTSAQRAFMSLASHVVTNAAGITNGYAIGLEDGRPILWFVDPSGRSIKTEVTGPDLRDNTYYHLAFNIDSSAHELNVERHLNGVLWSAQTFTNISPELPLSGVLNIGRTVLYPDSHYSGELDELYIHNRLLSATLIKEIVAKGVAPRCEMANCDVAETLLGWWRGEGNAADSMRFADGTNFGANFVPGLVGSAFLFTARDQYIEVPHKPELNFPGGKFTIEAWIQPQPGDGSGQYYTIVDKRIVSGDRATGYALLHFGSGIAFQFTDTDWSRPATTWHVNYPGLLNGSFHHIAVSVDRGKADGVVIYVNGVVAARFNPQVEPFSISTDSPLRIARGVPNTTQHQFFGRIDEVALHAAALTQAEILSIYNSRGNRCGGFPTDTDGDGLPDAWEDEYGFNKLDPNDAGEDADDDGTSNLEEYLYRTNPLSMTTGFRVGIGFTRVGALQLRVRSAPSRIYQLDSKPFIGGEWQEFRRITADGNLVIFDLEEYSQADAYFRVRLLDIPR